MRRHLRPPLYIRQPTEYAETGVYDVESLVENGWGLVKLGLDESTRWVFSISETIALQTTSRGANSARGS